MNARIIVVILAATLAVAAVTTAFAHAEPATVRPGDGAILKTAPTIYEIVMSQEMFKDTVGSNDIDIFDASGKEVTTISAVIDNADRRKLSVVLPTGLPAGEYRVEWKTLSADDGDAANGTLKFSVEPAGTPNPGKEQLKESAAAPTVDAAITPSGISGAVPSTTSGGLSTDKANITWVTTIAVGLVMFALGAGVSYIALDRKR